MYEKKDLMALNIAQKAREFGDGDLINEALVSQLINAPLNTPSAEEKKGFNTIFKYTYFKQRSCSFKQVTPTQA